MAQVGSLSSTLAKAFSASSYSKECSRATARLKSLLTLLQVMVKWTDPNCSLGGPQAMMSPLLICMALMRVIEGAEVFCPQSVRSVAQRITGEKNHFFMAKSFGRCSHSRGRIERWIPLPDES